MPARRNSAGYLLFAVFNCCTGVQHDTSIPFLSSIAVSNLMGELKVSQGSAAFSLQPGIFDMKFRFWNPELANPGAERVTAVSGLSLSRQNSARLQCMFSGADEHVETPNTSGRLQTLRLRGGKSKSEGRPLKTKDHAEKRESSKAASSESSLHVNEDLGDDGFEAPEQEESEESRLFEEYITKLEEGELASDLTEEKWNRLPNSNKTREQLIDEIKNHNDDAIQAEFERECAELEEQKLKEREAFRSKWLREKEEQRLEKIASRRVKEPQPADVTEQSKPKQAAQRATVEDKVSTKVSKKKKKGLDAGKQQPENINPRKKDKKRKK